jgi:hypothetical protein
VLLAPPPFGCEDIDATKTSKLLSINRNTINRYFNIFRLAIFYANQPENIKISGTFDFVALRVNLMKVNLTSLRSSPLRVEPNVCEAKEEEELAVKNPRIWIIKA